MTVTYLQGKGLIVAVVGRFANDPAPPFEPRLELRGLSPTLAETAELHVVLNAAMEGSLPWIKEADLEARIRGMLESYVTKKNWGPVDIDVVIMSKFSPARRISRQ